MVCPYSFDVAGGVQAHIVDLARAFIERGHKVSVLAPASEETELPDFVVSAGKSIAIPYNGSVARLSFGPKPAAKVKKWLSENDFDVLHIHEPNAPSLSLLALMTAEGPIVATFHTSTTKSFALSTMKGLLRPLNEKITGRIAVSELARRWQVEALGSDAVEIPNGVEVSTFSHASYLPGYPRAGKTVLFLGRYDEPRKGMDVLLGALPSIVERHPDVEILIVGRGEEEKLRKQAGENAKHLRLLGAVTDAEKAAAMRSADVYVAPNLGGESFGIVLVEAMAAGTVVVASQLDAFRRVLRDGKAGVLFPLGDSAALADAINDVLSDDAKRNELISYANDVVAAYDWPVVAEQIMRVYETVTVGGLSVRAASS